MPVREAQAQPQSRPGMIVVEAESSQTALDSVETQNLENHDDHNNYTDDVKDVVTHSHLLYRTSESYHRFERNSIATIAQGAITGNIFISYRREDAAAYAGRLCDHLSALFGADRVFMDLDDISPGKNFAQTIDETLAGCDAALVVIGPRWRDILLVRLPEQKTDYVCHEIEAAIARNITVVPVLVGGATTAQLNDLPGPLASLPMYQAVELRDNSFKDDCVRLAQSLGSAPDRAGTALHKWVGVAGCRGGTNWPVDPVSILDGLRTLE